MVLAVDEVRRAEGVDDDRAPRVEPLHLLCALLLDESRASELLAASGLRRAALGGLCPLEATTLDRLFARGSDAPSWLWHVPFALTTTVMGVLAVILAAFLHRIFQTPWLDAGMLMPLTLGVAAVAMIVLP